MLQSLTTLQDVPNMYDWFTRMRATQPVWLDEKSQCWHIFRYKEVLQVMADDTIFSSEQHPDAHADQAPNFAMMDPPRHQQYRNLVSSAFTPRALAPLSPRISTVVQELLAPVRPTGQMDLIADLAQPLPAIIIAEMLGLPIADHPRFQRWADALFAQQVSDEALFPERDRNTTPSSALSPANTALAEMDVYFKHLLYTRRLQPRQDLMSTLLAATIEGKPLSQEEMVSFCTLLLLAGHVTTTSLLGQAVLCLDSHPAALHQLREQPELIASTIEEVLRYASPVWRIMRVAREAVEIANVTIPADAVIFAWLASANRDETHFSHPERFDIRRTPNRHVAFGHGIHACLGAPLARMEASIALPLLLEQLPDLRVVREPPLEVLRSHILFGVKSLPVIFTPFALAPSRTAR